MLSPTGTDPDSTNPQTFCFTSTLCPNAEGFKDLLSFKFLFLKLCRPCPVRYFLLVEHFDWRVSNLPLVAHLGALASTLYNEYSFCYMKISLPTCKAMTDKLSRSLSHRRCAERPRHGTWGSSRSQDKDLFISMGSKIQTDKP